MKIWVVVVIAVLAFGAGMLTYKLAFDKAEKKEDTTTPPAK